MENEILKTALMESVRETDLEKISEEVLIEVLGHLFEGIIECTEEAKEIGRHLEFLSEECQRVRQEIEKRINNSVREIRTD